MSVLGRITTRSTVTIYRPVEAETGDLGRKVSSWTVVAADLAARIVSESDELMQKVFGTPATVKDRIYLAGAPDIQPGDAVKATAKNRSGETWRVQVVLTLDQAGRPHKEAALESTTETIP